MNILTVTARGQVTLRREILSHLGLKPGDKLELELLPGGKGVLQAAAKSGDIEEVIGFLAQKNGKKASLDDIQDVIAEGWTGKP